MAHLNPSTPRPGGSLHVPPFQRITRLGPTHCPHLGLPECNGILSVPVQRWRRLLTCPTLAGMVTTREHPLVCVQLALNSRQCAVLAQRGRRLRLRPSHTHRKLFSGASIDRVTDDQGGRRACGNHVHLTREEVISDRLQPWHVAQKAIHTTLIPPGPTPVEWHYMQLGGSQRPPPRNSLAREEGLTRWACSGGWSQNIDLSQCWRKHGLGSHPTRKEGSRPLTFIGGVPCWFTVWRELLQSLYWRDSLCQAQRTFLRSRCSEKLQILLTSLGFVTGLRQPICSDVFSAASSKKDARNAQHARFDRVESAHHCDFH